jgi:hypothetical protein
MIALGFIASWLTLTATGSAALSALGRIELDNELGPERVSHAERVSHDLCKLELALTETWPATQEGSPL